MNRPSSVNPASLPRKLFQAAMLCGWWMLLLVLIGAFFLQLTVAIRGRIPLPPGVKPLIENLVRDQGYEIRFEKSYINPRGQILLEKASATTVSIHEPILEAGRLILEVPIVPLLTGQHPTPHLEAEQAELRIPTMFSPSGTSEKMVSDASLALDLLPDAVVIRHLSAKVANSNVTFHGEIPRRRPVTNLPPGAPPAKTTRELLPELFRRSKNLIGLADRLAPLGPVDIDLGLDLSGSTPWIDVSLRVRNLELPEKLIPRLSQSLILEDTAATTRIPLNSTESLLPLSLLSAKVRLGDQIQADEVRLEMNLPTTLQLETLLDETSIQISATRLKVGTQTADSLHGTFAKNLAVLSLRLADTPWLLECERQPDSSARVSFNGTISSGLLAWLNPLSPIDLPELLQPERAAPVSGEILLSEGFKPVSAQARLEAHDVTAHHVFLDTASADLFWAGDQVRCENIVLQQGDSDARGRYEMDIPSLQYRFLLSGRLRPLGIGGWFHEWWADFWNHFDFGDNPATADVDIQGRWSRPDDTTVYVGAYGENLGLNHVSLDSLHTQLWVRPHWIDVLHFSAQVAGHKALGSFGREYDPVVQDWKRMDFSVTSDLPLAAVGGILGDSARHILTPFSCSEPPQITLNGELNGPAFREDTHDQIDFTINCPATFTLYDYPLENISVDGRYLDGNIHLDHTRGYVAGGLLLGTAIISGPEDDRWIALDYELTGADLGAAYEYINRNESGSSTNEVRSRLEGGKLTLTLQASGEIGTPRLLQGAGRASITNATKLGEIPLLGPLSELLKSAKIGFTNLMLSDVRADYRLGQGLLNFTRLDLSGPSALVQTSGKYDIATGGLDMRAKVSPFEQQQGILSSAASFVLSPLSRILEVQIGGTVQHPKWNFIYGPKGLIRSLTGIGSNTDTPAIDP